MGDVAEDELTEFELIEVESIKGVPMGANGFPHLIMKGIASDEDAGTTADTSRPFETEVQPAHQALTGQHLHLHLAHGGPDANNDGLHQHVHEHSNDAEHDHEHDAGDDAGKSALDLAVKAVTRGKIDEGPDVGLGKQIMTLLGQAIANEADEIAAGAFGETCDVDLLNRAAGMISRWLGREAGAGQQDGWDDVVMAAAMDDLAAKAKMSAAAINDLPDSAFAYIEDGGEKDSEGKTTPRSKRHFPVHDKAHADNAAARIAQGAEFGDKALPKVKAAQKEFGSNSDDAGKSAVAEGETGMDTLTQDGLAKAVEDAVAKATAASQDRVKQVEERAAKAEQRVDQLEQLIKSAPVHGGPVLSANARPQGGRSADADDLAAKAALYRQKADDAVTPADREGYRLLAREYQEKADKTA